ncbi:MAG: hypothetical protein ABJC19_02525 [Gemmatimonadota bacterium]
MTSESRGGSAVLVHLSCFGGLRVTAETPLGPGFLDPRRVALLAVLAAAGREGVRRERLRDLLWEDNADGAADRELEAALAALRRGGNGDALLLGDDTVRLHPDRVTSDVAEFLAAVDRDDSATIARLYEGPFLHGVALDAGPRFATWLADSREYFAELFQQAMSRSRSGADVRSDAAVDEALPRWRRWWWGVPIACGVVAVVWFATRPRTVRDADAAMAHGAFGLAADGYQRAVARRPADAMLWFKLSRAWDASGNVTGADSASRRADALTEQRSRDEARLVHGQQLWREGRIVQALASLDSLLRERPNDPNAWALRALVVTRSGALIGVSRESALPALERVTTLDPSRIAAWRALLALALGRGDTTLASRAWTAMERVTTDSQFRWLPALWSADTMALTREIARLPMLSPRELLDHAVWIGLVTGRTTDALRVTDALLARPDADAFLTETRLLRAQLYGSVADWSGLEQEGRALCHTWPWGGMMLEVAAALAPARTVDRAALRALRDRLAAVQSDSAQRPLLLPGWSRTLRLYLVGELSARLGDAGGVQAAVDSLASPKLGELELPRRGGSYALSLQALQLAQRGDSAGALTRLEQAAASVGVGAQELLWVNGSLERRRRVRLLEAVGRLDEARGWAGSLGGVRSDLLLGPTPAP